MGTVYDLRTELIIRGSEQTVSVVDPIPCNFAICHRDPEFFSQSFRPFSYRRVCQSSNHLGSDTRASVGIVNDIVNWPVHSGHDDIYGGCPEVGSVVSFLKKLFKGSRIKNVFGKDCALSILHSIVVQISFGRAVARFPA